MKSLEASKLFPYLAWGIILLFSVLTFLLVTKLQVSVDRLGQQDAQRQSLQGLTSVKTASTSKQ